MKTAMDSVISKIHLPVERMRWNTHSKSEQAPENHAI